MDAQETHDARYRQMQRIIDDLRAEIRETARTFGDDIDWTQDAEDDDSE